MQLGELANFFSENILIKEYFYVIKVYLITHIFLEYYLSMK